MTQTDQTNEQTDPLLQTASIPQLAAALHCSPDVLYALLLHLGLSGDEPTNHLAPQRLHPSAVSLAAEIRHGAPVSLDALRLRAPAPNRRQRSRVRRARTYTFDAERVCHLYHAQGKTLQQVASHLRTSVGTLLKAMDEWQIPRRRPGPRSKAMH